MSDVPKKKRTFRKYSYRGIDLDQLLELSSEDVSNADALVLMHFRISAAPIAFTFPRSAIVPTINSLLDKQFIQTPNAQSALSLACG